MMGHPGEQLVKLAKQAGGELVYKKGHHEVWKVAGKTFRIATAGNRPTYLMTELASALRSIIERQDAEIRRKKPHTARHQDPIGLKTFQRAKRLLKEAAWLSEATRQHLEADLRSWEKKNLD